MGLVWCLLFGLGVAKFDGLNQLAAPQYRDRLLVVVAVADNRNAARGVDTEHVQVGILLVTAAVDRDGHVLGRGDAGKDL